MNSFLRPQIGHRRKTERASMVALEMPSTSVVVGGRSTERGRVRWGVFCAMRKGYARGAPDCIPKVFDRSADASLGAEQHVEDLVPVVAPILSIV